MTTATPDDDGQDRERDLERDEAADAAIERELDDEDTSTVLADAEESVVAEQLAERTADLQRLQAEFANYRKRTEREKLDSVDRGKAQVAEQLLPILDDLDRAREHGDLESGPLKAVAEKLTAVLGGVGVTEFGAAGDAFNPELHEAVQNDGSGSEPVIGAVLRKGYKVGDRVLRHAMVAVTDRPDAGGATSTGEKK